MTHTAIDNIHDLERKVRDIHLMKTEERPEFVRVTAGFFKVLCHDPASKYCTFGGIRGSKTTPGAPGVKVFPEDVDINALLDQEEEHADSRHEREMNNAPKAVGRNRRG